MPYASAADGVKLYYEEVGQGTPIVFVHEFADDVKGWAAQVKFFARRYRTIAYNARGYPPSDVPQDPERYSQAQAAEDIKTVLDHLKLAKAHVVGLSMGGYATLHFGLNHPDRALSLVVGGAGYGSVGADRAAFHKDTDHVIAQFDQGMTKVAEFYTRGPTRVQFIRKDPVGWQAFYDRFAEQNSTNPRLQFEAAKSYRRVGQIRARLNQGDSALAAFNRSTSSLTRSASRLAATRTASAVATTMMSSTPTTVVKTVSSERIRLLLVLRTSAGPSITLPAVS